VIRLDPLGLDLLYLQAKRYEPDHLVDVATVRDVSAAGTISRASWQVGTVNGFWIRNSACDAATVFALDLRMSLRYVLGAACVTAFFCQRERDLVRRNSTRQ
jgi:hypothetical protein